MPYPASIGIFQNHTDDEGRPNVPKPMVPDEVFAAAKRVLESKGCEYIRSGTGMYVVKYSEFGPFQTKTGSDWHPVYIAKLQTWISGGIRLEEMRSYDVDHPTNQPQTVAAPEHLPSPVPPA